MKESLVDVLACPDCRSPLECRGETGDAGHDEIETGSLTCMTCGKVFPIVRGIPRFVDRGNDAASPGLQWTLFRQVQLDSYNGSTLSSDRVFSETGLTPESVAGKWILDAGCGTGRFLEALSERGGRLVGLEFSDRIEVARRTLGRCRDTDLVQGSMLALPFKNGVFDVCYSIGSLQEAPDPERCLRALPRVVKPGGQVAITAYERRRWTRLNAKYLVRPITRRWSHSRLLATIIEVMPFAYPLIRRLFSIPTLGRAFTMAIPVADCSRLRGLNDQDRYRFTVLDTFDMLSRKFDSPMTEPQVRAALALEGVPDARRLTGAELNMIGEKVG